MIGLDTNVLVRILTRDDPSQLESARAYLAAHCSQADPAFVCREVVLETVWVLESSYGYERTDVANALERILRTIEMLVEDADLVENAKRDYLAGADFPDAMIAAVNAARGCTATATFDRAGAARFDQFALISW